MTSVAEAARSGDHRALLEALRDTLAMELDASLPATALNPVVGRLVEVSRELHDMPDPAQETEAERIARRVAEGGSLDD